MSRCNPCVRCNNRSIGCHGRCNAYREWKQNHEYRNEIIRKNKYKDRLMTHTSDKAIGKSVGQL